jgi:hypothetical protein
VALSDTRPANSTNRTGKQGMGLLTLFGFLTFFVIGFVVGALVQIQKHEDERKQESIAYWRWARSQENIEHQMLNDGWKL